MEQPFLIYDASAGSGKTYTLVKEYLKIVFGSKSPDAYRNILAITFTNKAVHEMKSRIVNSLSAFAKDPDAADEQQRPSAKDLEFMAAIGGEIGLNPTQMRNKAREILRHLIHNYAAFDISTIDKFTHKVIRAFARDLNLPLTFEVSVEDDALLREAVDALVAKAGEEPELTQLLLQYAMEKADDDKSWEIAREIYETGRLSRNETDRAELSAFDEFSISDFETVRTNLKSATQQIGEQMAAIGHEIQNIIRANGIDETSFGRGSFPNFYRSAIAGTYKPATRVFDSHEKLAVKKNAPDAALIESVSEQLLELSGRIYELYAKRCLYQDVLKTIVPLSLLNTLSGTLAELQREKNILPISDFNALIHKELQEQPAPFVYERLGERYRHFFIDEFQDTSQMQWENLVPLIHDSLSGSDAAGRAGSLLLVGDPKQSIYRWRGGKAEQFIALAGDYNPFGNISKKTERLGVNYRSYDAVIDFNNRFFKFASTRFENPEYRRLYEELSHQECNDKKGGFVQINFVEKTSGSDHQDSDDDETDNSANLKRMLDVVADLRDRGFAYSEMAILVRKVAQGTAAAKCLSERGIPILSSEILMLANAEEVKFMLSVLRYLHNEDDVVSKARALQFIGAHLQDQLPVADFITQGMAVSNDQGFADWLSGQGLGLNFKMLRMRGLFEVVEHISKQLPQRQSAYVQYFLDIALEREQRYQSGLGDFLDYWNLSGEKLSIPLPESEDAVRIMTIHKSKGLEFPVVIMPFADDDFGRVMRGTKIWIDNPDDEMLGLPKMLLNQSAQIKNYGDRAVEVYSQKEQERLLDNINILYVALTRAGEQLHLISTLKLKKDGTPSGNTTASLLVDFLGNTGDYVASRTVYTFGDPRKISAPVSPAAVVETIRAVDSPMPFSKIKIARREALMWGTTQSDAIELGNLLHEILSAVTSASNVNNALDAALDSGIISASQREVFYTLITEITTHPEIAHCFDDSMRVLNEQVIIRPDETVLKPDRISIDPHGTVHLIDYKTGEPTPAHRQQIESYAGALSQMGYNVAKKALVYTRPKLNVVHL